ncbi:MAG: hypothetical protein NUV90_02555 [Candidatus Parcubacteria bacterium]|nr:hypothetical protein [Candidatus Parcubacteria bacterium]
MSAEGFEKTRIQDPEKAQEMANMVKAQAESHAEKFHRSKENLTAEDYNKALTLLEQLQKELLSPAAEKATKPVRDLMAAVGAVGDNVQDLLGWTLLSVVPASFWKKAGIRETALPQERLIEFVKALGEGKLVEDYKANRVALESAHEMLKRRRVEAEEISKR